MTTNDLALMDTVDAEAARLVRSGEIDTATQQKLRGESKGDDRALAHLLVAHAWRDKPWKATDDARESRLRLAAALVDARRASPTKSEIQFLQAAIKKQPDLLARLPFEDALVLRLAMRKGGAKPPELSTPAPTTADAIAVLRARLVEMGAKAAALDKLRASLADPALELHALAALELELRGFDTRALDTPEGRAEAKRLADMAAYARSERTLRAADAKWLRERIAKDKDYLVRCGTRGAFVAGLWRPLLNAREIALLQLVLAPKKGGR